MVELGVIPQGGVTVEATLGCIYTSKSLLYKRVLTKPASKCSTFGKPRSILYLTNSPRPSPLAPFLHPLNPQVAGGSGQAEAPGAQERALGHALRRGVRLRALDSRRRPLPYWPGVLNLTG